MLLAWLSRLCASILLPVLLLATLGLTLNQTLFKGQYIKDELQKANAYSKLSDGITQEAVKNTNTPGVPNSEVQAQLKTIITPAVLQAKINTTIDQFTAYYNGKGPAPTLDITDLVARAQAAGLPAPDDPKFKQPIAIPVATKAKHAGDTIRKAVLFGGIITLLLIIIMVSIAFVRHNFKPLANFIISLGVSVLLLGLALYLAPNVVNKVVKIGTNTNGFVDVGRDLMTNIAHDLGKRLLISGAIYEVVGIGSRIVLGRFSKPKQVPELLRDDPPVPVPSANTQEKVSEPQYLTPPPATEKASSRKIQL